MPGIENLAPDRTDTSRGRSGSAEHEAGALLEAGQSGVDLVPQALRVATGGEEGAARLRRDDEAGWDREPQAGHLGQPGALAAEQLSHRAIALVELEDERALGGGGVSEAVMALSSCCAAGPASWRRLTRGPAYSHPAPRPPWGQKGLWSLAFVTSLHCRPPPART